MLLIVIALLSFNASTTILTLKRKGFYYIPGIITLDLARQRIVELNVYKSSPYF